MPGGGAAPPVTGRGGLDGRRREPTSRTSRTSGPFQAPAQLGLMLLLRMLQGVGRRAVCQKPLFSQLPRLELHFGHRKIEEEMKLLFPDDLDTTQHLVLKIHDSQFLTSPRSPQQLPVVTRAGGWRAVWVRGKFGDRAFVADGRRLLFAVSSEGGLSEASEARLCTLLPLWF